MVAQGDSTRCLFQCPFRHTSHCNATIKRQFNGFNRRRTDFTEAGNCPLYPFPSIAQRLVQNQRIFSGMKDQHLASDSHRGSNY